MATFLNKTTSPALSIDPSYDSSEKTLDDLQLDRASNGNVRIRALFAAVKKQFTLVYEGATATDRTNLASFYWTNRLLSVSFVWAADGQTYTCYFAGPPQYQPLIGSRWKITVELVQA